MFVTSCVPVRSLGGAIPTYTCGRGTHVLCVCANVSMEARPLNVPLVVR